MTLLWLDDERNPWLDDWVEKYSPINPTEIIWVKSYDEFVDYIQTHGLPTAICFDHDLGDTTEDELNGYSCALQLVNFCIETNQKLPLFNSQSMNPVGKQNILSLLNNFNKYYEINKQI